MVVKIGDFQKMRSLETFSLRKIPNWSQEFAINKCDAIILGDIGTPGIHTYKEKIYSFLIYML